MAICKVSCENPFVLLFERPRAFATRLKIFPPTHLVHGCASFNPLHYRASRSLFAIDECISFHVWPFPVRTAWALNPFFPIQQRI